MLLAYLDESFSKDWYFMAALLCDGAGAQAIGAGLDDVAAKAVRAFGVADDAELHGYELSRAKAGGRPSNPRARIGVYNQAFQVLADNSRALILRGMDSAGQRRGTTILVTFLYRRMQTHQESDPRATRANEALWSRIAPLVVHQRCWRPA